MKNMKKTLALLLALAMCVSMLGTTALAAPRYEEEVVAETPMGEEVREGSQKSAAPAQLDIPEEVEEPAEIEETPAAAELLEETVSGTMTGDALLGKAVDGVITLDGDVTLTSTMTVNEDITLELGGHTLRTQDVSGGNNASARVLSTSGAVTLTIQNGTVKGGTIYNLDVNLLNSAVKVNGNATLIVDNATIKGADAVRTEEGTNKYQGSGAPAIDTWKTNTVIIRNHSTVEGGNGKGYGSAYISGGKNQAEGGKAIAMGAGTLTITDSTVTGGSSNNYNAEDAISVSGTTVTITNSTVTGGTAGRDIPGYGIGGDAISVSMNGADITVENSTIAVGAPGHSWAGICLVLPNSLNSGKNVDISLQNGTKLVAAQEGDPVVSYCAGTNAPDIQMNVSGTVTVSKGKLANKYDKPQEISFAAQDADTKIVTEDGATIPESGIKIVPPEGAEVVKGEDGNITFAEKEPVATVGEQTYFTLQAAIGAAGEGDTIKLLKDTTVELTASTTWENVTIEGVAKADGTMPTITVSASEFPKTLTLKNSGMRCNVKTVKNEAGRKTTFKVDTGSWFDGTVSGEGTLSATLTKAKFSEAAKISVGDASNAGATGGKGVWIHTTAPAGQTGNWFTPGRTSTAYCAEVDGEYYYEDVLQLAINAAADKDKPVKLLNGVVANGVVVAERKTVTIDLNGQSWLATTALVNNGTVTITSSSDKMGFAPKSGGGAVAVVNNGTMTIEGGLFKKADDGKSLTNNGTLNINGGCFVTIPTGGTINVPENKEWVESNVPSVGICSALVEKGNAEAAITRDGVETKYKDLTSAISAATAGDTVKLLTDVAVDVTPYFGKTSTGLEYVFVIGKSLTLDMNGKTVKWDATEEEVAEELTMNPVFFRIYGENTKVVFEGNGTIDTELGGNGNYGIDVGGGAALTIKNGTYYGAPTAIQVTNGSLCIEDGTFEMSPTCKTGRPDLGKYIVNVVDRYWASGEAVVALQGGTYGYDYINNNPETTSNPNANGMSYVPSEITGTATEGTCTLRPRTENDADAVAQVGDKVYATLQAAIDNCPAGGTVTVLKDSDENIVLPLRSLTLTSEGETKPVLTGKVDFAAGNVPADTQVTIENLAFQNTRIKLVGWNMTTEQEMAGGLTIRNNTFTGPAVDETGNIYAIHINNSDTAVRNLTITGNVFDGCGVNDGGGVYATTCGQLVVTGNTFRNSAMNALTLTGKDKNGHTVTSAVITENVFENWAAEPADRADGRAMRLDKFDCDVDLTENSYVSTNLPEEYIKLTGLAEGKKADVNKCYWGGNAPAANKLLGISPVLSYYTDAEMTKLAAVSGSDVVAMIGSTGYPTLEAAIKAAVAGDTVELLDNVATTAQIDITKNITLNGNGKTLTYTNGNAAATSRISALQVYHATVAINDLTIVHNTGAALIVNGGTVTATNLETAPAEGADQTASNFWGGVNVDNSGTLDVRSGCSFGEENKIWQDDGHSKVKGLGGGWNTYKDSNGQTFYTTNTLSMTLNRNTATIYSNSTPRTVTLTATVSGILANKTAKVSWTSSNEAVATVDENGLVTAVANGAATITASSGKLSATCEITVSTYTPSSRPSNTEDLGDNDVPLTDKPFLFTDVAESDWFYDAVKYAFNNDLMLGTTDTTFEPAMTASRGMIVTMLYRLEKEPTAAAKADFPDVEDGAWYTEAVHWGNEAGVVTGYSDGRYAPDDMITREQLVVILYRYAKLKGCDVSARADLSKYADADQVSGYATEAMAWAVEIGLVKGTSDTTLSPAGDATRGQIATIMTRLCEDVLPKEA